MKEANKNNTISTIKGQIVFFFSRFYHLMLLDEEALGGLISGLVWLLRK